MVKAFLYDRKCGILNRCMFAGIDENGRAQWLNITPGEDAQPLDTIEKDVYFGKPLNYDLLSMEGELAESVEIATVLAKAMECPADNLDDDLMYDFNRMQRLGVKWNTRELKFKVHVFENPEFSHQRRGKYTFWLTEVSVEDKVLADVDGFDDLEELFSWVRTYFLFLKETAGIPIEKKTLSIGDYLLKEAKLIDLDIFEEIEKEGEDNS